MKFRKGDIIQHSGSIYYPLEYVTDVNNNHYTTHDLCWNRLIPQSTDYVEQYYILVTEVFREE